MVANTIVYFKWVDAIGNSGWFTADDVSPPMECEAIGFLVKETKTYITIATGRTASGDFMGYVTIPKGWIKKRKAIKV